MARDYSRRVEQIMGKRVRVTVGWIDGGESRTAAFTGVVSDAFSLGRESFLVLDRGATALGASRIITIEEVSP